MRIIVTGTPGTGKTSIAKALGKQFGYRVLGEKEFALEKKIGRWDEKEEELVIPLGLFGKELKALLEREKNIVVEGHLLCELRLPTDFVVLVTINPEQLEKRLRKRGYSEEKVQDNVFCESNGYCKKHVLRNYALEKVIEVSGGKTIKEALDYIIKEFLARGVKI